MLTDVLYTIFSLYINFSKHIRILLSAHFEQNFKNKNISTEIPAVPTANTFLSSGNHFTQALYLFKYGLNRVDFAPRFFVIVLLPNVSEF